MQLSSTVPMRQDRLRWNQFNHRHQHRREKKQHGSGHSTKPKPLAFSEQPPRITSNVNTVAIVSLRRRPCSTTFLNSSSRFIVDDYLNRKTCSVFSLQENESKWMILMEQHTTQSSFQSTLITNSDLSWTCAHHSTQTTTKSTSKVSIPSKC